MKKYKIIVERTATGFSAFADKYPVVTTGKDITSLRSNIVDAFNFYFSELKENITVSDALLDFNFSIQSLFDLYPINARHFALRIGMNYTLLAQYIQGRKKPSGKQSERIVGGLQEIGRELVEVKMF